MAVPAAALELAVEHGRLMRRAFVASQSLRVHKNARLRTVADRGRATRLALEDQWQAGMEQLSDEWLRRVDIQAGIEAAQWTPPPDEPDELYAGELRPAVEKRLYAQRAADIDKVEGWGGMRGIYGLNALMQDGKPGWEVVVLRDSVGEPRAVAAYQVQAGEMRLELLASRQGGGNGTDMMRELATRAGRQGLGINLVASSPESSAWYAKLGMSRWQLDEMAGAKPDPEGHRFKFTSAQARQFSQTGGWVAPNTAEMQAAMMSTLNAAGWALDGTQLYLALAQGSSVAAGQWSLDAMGLNRTWAWAHPRAMAADMFAVRGSKVIQNMHGSHMQRLTSIITQATSPTKPWTVAQVRNKIMAEWPNLKKWQALRIARTETAAVWTTTAANAYMANGVTHVESLVAHGPSIDADVNGACDICVEEAARGPIEIMGDLPPWHPNCRCDIVPVLQDSETGEQWIPPADPWTGGAEVPVCGSPAASAALLKRNRLEKMRSVRVLKAKAACAVPAPEPGEAFGGDIYKNHEFMQAEHLEGWRQAIEQWPDEQSRNAALQLLNENVGESFKAVYSAGAGELKAIAAYELREGTKELLVKGVATKAGGGIRVLTSMARDAEGLGYHLTVRKTGISPSLAKTLDGMGFESAGAASIYMPTNKLKATFKWKDEPDVPAAQQAGQAPTGIEEPHGIANPETWGLTDLLSGWDNPSHGPQVKAAIEAELTRRGLTVERARQQLAESLVPGTRLDSKFVFQPGGWKKADGTKYIDEHLKGEAYGSRLKAQTMKRISEVLKKDPKWNADAISRGYGYHGQAYGAQGDEAIVSQLINNWAQTSSDADKRALAIQQAAKEEFDLDVDVFPAHFAGGRESASAQRLIQETMDLLDQPGVRDGLRAFLRAQYNVTQESLQAAGVTHVTLYRGIRAQTDEGWMGRPGFGEVTVTDNPLASWSTRWGQSKKFAGHYGQGSRGIMLRAEVPRELVMGYPGYGFGCSHEFEVVLLNHGRNTAWALVSGHKMLTAEDVARLEARERAAIEAAEKANVALTEANAAWEAVGRPWRGPEYSARSRAHTKWQNSDTLARNLRRQINEGKEHITLGAESEMTKRIKELAPARPTAGKAKPGKPSAGTQEDIRLLGKRIASMKHKLKYPEKYNHPGGWSAAERADIEAKILAMEDERKLLKEGGGAAAMNLGDEAGQVDIAYKVEHAKIGDAEMWNLIHEGDEEAFGTIIHGGTVPAGKYQTVAPDGEKQLFGNYDDAQAWLVHNEGGATGVVVEWDMGLGGGPKADETAMVDGVVVGQVGENNYGQWNAHYKGDVATDFPTKEDAKAWLESKIHADDLGAGDKIEGLTVKVEDNADGGVDVFGAHGEHLATIAEDLPGQYTIYGHDGAPLTPFETWEEAAKWVDEQYKPLDDLLQGEELMSITKLPGGSKTTGGEAWIVNQGGDGGTALVEKNPDGTWTAKIGYNEATHPTLQEAHAWASYEIVVANETGDEAMLAAMKTINPGDWKETTQITTIDGTNVLGAVQKWSNTGNKWLVTLDSGEQVLVTGPKKGALGVFQDKANVKIDGAGVSVEDFEASSVSIAEKDASNNFLSNTWGSQKESEQIGVDLVASAWPDPTKQSAAMSIIGDHTKGELFLYHDGYGKLIGVARLTKVPGENKLQYRIMGVDLDAEAKMFTTLKTKVPPGAELVVPPSPLDAAKLKEQIHQAGKRIASYKFQIKKLDQGAPSPGAGNKIEELEAKMKAAEEERELLRAQLKDAEAAAPASKPPPVPESKPAQPLHVDGAAESAVKQDYWTGAAKTEEMSVGGNTHAGIELVETANGKKVVVKQVNDVDAVHEELSSMVANAIGPNVAPTAVVVETGLKIKWKPPWAVEGEPLKDKVVSKVVSEYLDGQTGAKWATDNKIFPKGINNDAPTPGMTDTLEGKLIGLLDVLSGNTDRHALNWMVVDGKAVAIDHGRTFGQVALKGDKVGVSGPFADNLVKTNKYNEIYAYKINDFTKADMDLVRTRLTNMKAQFGMRGKLDEWESMMNRLELIAKKAKGTVNLIA